MTRRAASREGAEETHLRGAIRMFEREHHASRDLLPRARQAPQQALEASQGELADFPFTDPLVFRRFLAVGRVGIRIPLQVRRALEQSGVTPLLEACAKGLTSSSKVTITGGS